VLDVVTRCRYDHRITTQGRHSILNGARRLQTAIRLAGLTVLAASLIGTTVVSPLLSDPAEASTLGSSSRLSIVPPVLIASPASYDFGNQRTGTYGATFTMTITNNGPGSDLILGVGTTGADFNDFAGSSTCRGATLTVGQSCTVQAVFSPESTGARSAAFDVADASGTHPISTWSGTGTSGYWIVGSHGGVSPYGDAGFYGQLIGNVNLNAPIIAMARTPNGEGYWLLGQDGGIFAFGNAGFFGSTGSFHLNQPVVGMAATPDGQGYWLVASDGGIFAFGDAGFFGSTGSFPLNKPIVGMAPAPNGTGYWLVASDGGVFAFGNAPFHGSTGSLALNQPIVGMAASPDGNGYLMVASDAGIFAFGDAAFEGSGGGHALAAPIIGIAETSDGAGYWLLGKDGGIFGLGDAPFYGSAAPHSYIDIIAMAPTVGPAFQLTPTPALRTHGIHLFPLAAPARPSYLSTAPAFGH
jgi:hypothetical protein